MTPEQTRKSIRYSLLAIREEIKEIDSAIDSGRSGLLQRYNELQLDLDLFEQLAEEWNV